jgi:hypothetical protein
MLATPSGAGELDPLAPHATAFSRRTSWRARFDDLDGRLRGRAAPPVHLALPLGLLGLAGAWIVADYYRFGVALEQEAARGTLAFAMPFASAAIGLLLSSRAVRRERWRTYAAGLAAIVLTGIAVGALIGALIGSRGYAAETALTGASTALAFLPAAALIVELANTAGRARIGSLVDAADRRAPWAATATCIAVGCSLERLELTPLQLALAPTLPSIAVAISGLALASLVVMLVFDLRALAGARAASRSIVDMTPRDPATALACNEVVDVGVGDEEHEALFGGHAYRCVPTPIRVVRGAPARGIELLRRAAVRGVAFAVVGAAAFAVTASTPKHARPETCWFVACPR